MNLRIDPEEAVLLRQVLKSYLPSLEQEADETLNYDWRRERVEAELAVKSLVDKIEEAVANDYDEEMALRRFWANSCTNESALRFIKG
jgi:hypothetical protein